eukprot:Nitzschia sp. Nitz4//scaffold181_size46380//34608//35216//NITZ4_007183-RA/size46380-processed-gene-0.36-mRNA-1//-1//CDS//3329539528//8569//frame0
MAMSNLKANESSPRSDPWDELCMDPHRGQFEQGKAEGSKAGELSGYREGQALGQGKGLEFGLEIGFYQGVLSSIQQSMENDTHSSALRFNEKTSKHLKNLQHAIDDFPTVEELIASASNGQLPLENASLMESSDTEPMNEYDQADSETSPKRDVLQQMQLIRARYKILMVQLGKPQFSFQKVMQTSSQVDMETTAVAEDHEW